MPHITLRLFLLLLLLLCASNVFALVILSTHDRRSQSAMKISILHQEVVNPQRSSYAWCHEPDSEYDLGVYRHNRLLPSHKAMPCGGST